MPSLATNIEAAGRRRRYAIGGAAIAVALAAAAVMLLRGVDTGWRVLLFLPFWLAALGFFQARGGT